MTQVTFNEKIWIPSEDKFVFGESKNPRSGKKQYILRGLMLPFETVSRNRVLYNKESIESKSDQLIGRPLMYNHKVDGDSDFPYGHFTNSVCMTEAQLGWEKVFTVPGWYYEADVDPEEKKVIRKLERGDLRHVSIQLLGDRVEEKFDSVGNDYVEAFVGDIIEGSLVPAPGFLDTTTIFAEKLGKNFSEKKEDMTTTTGKGAIKPTQDLDKCKKEAISEEKAMELYHKVNCMSDIEQFKKGLAVEMEHFDTAEGDIEVVAKIVKDHLLEDNKYYDKLAKVHSEEVLMVVNDEKDEAEFGSNMVKKFQDIKRKNPGMKDAEVFNQVTKELEAVETKKEELKKKLVEREKNFDAEVKGLYEIEKKKHPELSNVGIIKLVSQKIEENKKNYGYYFFDDKSSEDKNELVREFLKIGDNKLKEILETYK